MDLKGVKQLAELMEECGLSHVEICEGEHKILLSKALAPQSAAQPEKATAPVSLAAEVAATATLSNENAMSAKPGEELTAPLVGSVYLAPQPGAAPFVVIGQKVKKGQTLCIIEAMKLMNEFAAPRDGEILEICAEDGAMAEFGQCLFRLL